MEPKQTLLLRVYQILYTYSDVDHPLLQQDIMDLLYKNYELTCERQAIGRNISLLKECGIDIYSDRKGSYLEEKVFEPSELRLLIDSILSSRHINSKHSKDLIDKLVKLGGVHFSPRVKHIHSVEDWNKTDNKDLLYNIDIIDEAIEQNKRIRFNYNKYGVDKKLHVSETHTASPYQMLVHNQHYYLFSRNEKWENIGYYRIDKITDIEILEDIATPIRSMPKYKNGINYNEISSCHPYMFADTPEKVVLKADTFIVDAAIDWFGYGIDVKDNLDDTVTITVTTSLNAMEYWAMQYGKYVEVLEPASLRDRVKKSLEIANNKYQ